MRRPGSGQTWHGRASRQGGTDTAKVEVLDLTDSASLEGQLHRDVITVPEGISRATHSLADPQQDASIDLKSEARCDTLPEGSSQALLREDARFCHENLSSSFRQERRPAGHQQEGSPSGHRCHESQGSFSSFMADCRSPMQAGVVAPCLEGTVHSRAKRKSKRDAPQKSGLRRSQSVSALRSSEPRHGDMRRSSSGASLRPSRAVFEAWQRNAPVDLD